MAKETDPKLFADKPGERSVFNVTVSGTLPTDFNTSVASTGTPGVVLTAGGALSRVTP
jgi:hypothetical protein